MLSFVGAWRARSSTTVFPGNAAYLADPMLTFWERHGGLPVFGYPISEAFPERNADTGQMY